MKNHIKRTFTDDYGRHALVYEGDGWTPAFGRIDVIHLTVDVKPRQQLHPTRVDADYEPRHAVGCGGVHFLSGRHRKPQWLANTHGWCYVTHPPVVPIGGTA